MDYTMQARTSIKHTQGHSWGAENPGVKTMTAAGPAWVWGNQT